MKLVYGGMMVILGLLFGRHNEVEEEPIVENEEDEMKKKDGDEEEEKRSLNNQGWFEFRQSMQ